MQTYWMETEVHSLKNKTVVMTGATGGLGSAMCRRLLAWGADLVMVNRNREKSQQLCHRLRKEFPQANIRFLICDLEWIDQVKAVTEALQQLPVDILMLNAGTYAIPRDISSAGYDTVFQTNFLSHYYMARTLQPLLEERKGKIVVTGSIAHQFNVLDPEDPDFFFHDGANNIYGNSKRFLMFSLMEALKKSAVDFAIGHPGISCTGITAHYPREALALVKPGMQLAFMPPQKACLSMLRAIFAQVPYGHWIGPGYFDIWGDPVISPLHTCSLAERKQIFILAEEMYHTL